MTNYEIYAGHVPQNMTLCGLLPSLHRMPEETAEKVSANVASLAKCASGGRVRFKTDSKRIKLAVELACEAPNCAADLLCDGVYVGKIAPPEDSDETYYEGEFALEGEAGEVCIFLPRTAEVKRLTVSLDDGASVLPPESYASPYPIVYYGSSITMGASSKSPSKSYTSLVSERLGYDHVNLGFGGSAKGERAMAEYIAGLKMSAFVLDYEHNADSIDYLRATHKPFFDIIRSAHPTLPILIISRPDTDADPVRCALGRRVVMDTYHAALDAGDMFVDYVDGFYLWGNEDRHLCHAGDGVHPNEVGFARMADVIAPRLKALLLRDGARGYVEEDGADDKYRLNL